jgi:hypothetical protein
MGVIKIRIDVCGCKMSTHFKVQLLALCTLLQILACSKDKLPDAGGTKLSKVIIRNKDRNIIFSSDYIYNFNSQLSQILSKQNQGVESEKQEFSFDPLGNYIAYKSTNELFGDIFFYEFQYGSNGKITRANSTPFLANLATDDYIFTYDSKGRVIADSIVNRGTNFVTFYHTYLYDNMDNVVDYQLFRRFGNDFQLFDKVTYTYDDKQNPYYINGLQLFVGGNLSVLYLSRNNIISSVSNGVSSIPGFYEYTYYSNGFVRTSHAGYINNGQTIEYYYQ